MFPSIIYSIRRLDTIKGINIYVHPVYPFVILTTSPSLHSSHLSSLLIILVKNASLHCTSRCCSFNAGCIWSCWIWWTCCKWTLWYTCPTRSTAHFYLEWDLIYSSGNCVRADELSRSQWGYIWYFMPGVPILTVSETRLEIEHLLGDETVITRFPLSKFHQGIFVFYPSMLTSNTIYFTVSANIFRDEHCREPVAEYVARNVTNLFESYKTNKASSGRCHRF